MIPYATTMKTTSNCVPFTAWPWMVGFERQIDTLAKMTESMGRGSTYPPYNIVKHDEDKFTVEMALAGFTKAEVSIQVKDNVLTIKGSKATKREDEFMHRGIGTRDFTSEFVLADYVEVAKAVMLDGILFVDLERLVPEEHKPKVIDIL